MLQGPETNLRMVAEIHKALVEQRAVAADILNYKAEGRMFWNALLIGSIFDHGSKLRVTDGHHQAAHVAGPLRRKRQ